MDVLIHWYDGSTRDNEGEPLSGFYYQFLNELDKPLTDLLMGPYTSSAEAELACQRAYDTDDY